MSVTDPDEVKRLMEQMKDLFPETPDVSEPVDEHYPDVTRVELISNSNRTVTIYGASEVWTSLQDDGRTLKVFLKQK